MERTGISVGSITYDGVAIHMDDRTLTHLEIVIVNKLRKGESFLMSWRDAPDVGDGRSAIWLHPYMLVYFKFEGSRVPQINESWLAELVQSADSSRGLIVTSEQGHLALIDRVPGGRPNTTLVEPAPDPATVAPTAPDTFRPE